MSKGFEERGWRLLYFSFIPLLLTVIIRFLVGLEYNTQVLVIEGYHALVDTVISGTILVVVYIVRSRYASKFQYGLYRLEDITALTIAVLILLTLVASLTGLWAPPTGNILIIILGQSLTIPFLLLVMYAKRRAGVLLRSPSLMADAAHMTVDVIESSTVALGLFLYYATNMVSLYYIAALAAIFGLLIAAYEAGFDSLKSLLDLPRDYMLVEKIRQVINSCDKNIDVVDLKVRWAGQVIFAEGLLRMHPLKTIDEAGETSKKLENCVKENIEEIKNITFKLEPSFRTYYKVVVPVDEATTRSFLSKHFAKSKHYYLAEINSNRIERQVFIENPFLTNLEDFTEDGKTNTILLGARISEYFHRIGVTDAIVLDIGEIAFALFLRHKIIVWRGEGQSRLIENIESFINHDLTRLTEPVTEASWEKRGEP